MEEINLTYLIKLLGFSELFIIKLKINVKIILENI